MRHGFREDTVVPVLLLAAVFAVRAFWADQPILENYVGRQIPTAMVARNLERGSGFLYPQLDTGPFPNLFLVEPPLAAQLAAWVAVATSWPLDRCGRLVSAAATTLAAWGLFGLMDRRRGPFAAVGTVIAFASFPVVIRYGRAFQPDCVAMGCLVAALNCWDRPGALRTVVGALLMAGGLAQKATWGLSIVPPLLVVWEGRRRTLWLLALGLHGVRRRPGIVHAVLRLGHSAPGSAASVGNATNWSARLLSPGFCDPAKLLQVARDLVVRSFTPIGFCLALRTFVSGSRADRLWTHWAAGSFLSLLLLFGKLHHDYYWLMAAPAVAGGVGIALDGIRARSRRTAVVAIAALIVMGMVQSRSTWQTPAAWRDAPRAARRASRNSYRTTSSSSPRGGDLSGRPPRLSPRMGG